MVPDRWIPFPADDLHGGLSPRSRARCPSDARHGGDRCDAKALHVDHLREKESIGRAPCRSHNAIRFDMRPAIVNRLRIQDFDRQTDLLLHSDIGLGQLPCSRRSASDCRFPCWSGLLWILIEEEIPVLLYDGLPSFRWSL